MQSDPLLTQNELDFIQKILFKPPQKRRPDAAPPLALGKRLSELLARLGNEEQLSLDTHTDNQHLSFPLHLIQDDHSQSRLELGAPLIFEQGGRGRDGSYLPPPAQIRTCGTTAYGSCLRFVTRSVPPDRDVQFWASVCRCLRDDQSVTTGVGYAGCAA